VTNYVGTETTSYPYSGVVYVESTFSNGLTYTGTGFMVGPNDVLTASHVIYSASDGGVATSVTVSPAHDDGLRAVPICQANRSQRRQNSLAPIAAFNAAERLVFRDTFGGYARREARKIDVNGDRETHRPRWVVED